jgi:hypothetical protein
MHTLHKKVSQNGNASQQTEAILRAEEFGSSSCRVECDFRRERSTAALRWGRYIRGSTRSGSWHRCWLHAADSSCASSSALLLQLLKLVLRSQCFLLTLMFELLSNGFNVPHRDSKSLIAFGQLKHFALKFQDYIFTRHSKLLHHC